jgi:hypothetical protein
VLVHPQQGNFHRSKCLKGKKKAANRKGSNLFSSEIQRDARAHQVTGRYREEKKGTK